MRKILVILLLILVLSGCQAGTLETPIEQELNRIKDIIPESFTEDLVLPEPSEGFEFDYEIENKNVKDNTITYTPSETSFDIELEIKILHNEIEEKYYITITNLGDEDIYEQYLIDKYFEDTFNIIDAYLPERVVSNTTMYEHSNGQTFITYSTSCGYLERNRLIYEFNETDQLCTLTSEIIYKGETRVEELDYIMSSIDNLPKLPAIYITTDLNQPIDSNETYTRATLTLDPNDNFDVDPLEDIPLGIRLRGNSTLSFPKKAFKIKFDEKIEFLNEHKEKDWILLANHVDQTLVRDAVAFNLAADLRMDFSPSYTFIDVYINGVYQGNYLLTDQIEVTNDRVNIEENVPDIDTGYLVEFDIGLYREIEQQGFTDQNYFLLDEWIPMVLKSPDSSDSHYSEAQKDYIDNYFNDLLNTLRNQEDYSELLDDSTFIDWYIVNEIMQNVDAGYSSVFFYKDKGGPVKMGPVWDFDLSSGNAGYIPRDPESFWVYRQDGNPFIYYLMQYSEFVDKLQDRWNELYYPVLRNVPETVLLFSDSITESRYQNFELWDVIGVDQSWYTAPELLALTEYNDHIWHLYDFLETRITWLNEEINNLT